MDWDNAPRRWPVEEAASHFEELLDACLSEGPQVVTHQGVERAVLLSVEEWRWLQEAGRPTLKELLLAECPRFDLPLPSRQRWGRRPSTLG